MFLMNATTTLAHVVRQRCRAVAVAVAVAVEAAVEAVVVEVKDKVMEAAMDVYLLRSLTLVIRIKIQTILMMMGLKTLKITVSEYAT